MSAEIIRGVDFKRKKRIDLGSIGNGVKSQEGLVGVLSIQFFYEHFVLRMERGNSKSQKLEAFETFINYYLKRVLNPKLSCNIEKPNWARESLKNLLRAIALIQSGSTLDYKTATDSQFKKESEELKYRIVFKKGIFFGKQEFVGTVGNDDDLERIIKSIIKNKI